MIYEKLTVCYSSILNVKHFHTVKLTFLLHRCDQDQLEKLKKIQECVEVWIASFTFTAS